MRKFLLFLVVGMACLFGHATPADPAPAQVTQPDGSQLTVVLHGDEFFNFLTTEDGYTVVKNAAGYYTYARLDGDRLVASDFIARDSRTAADRAYLASVPKGLTSPAKVQAGKRLRNHRNNVLRGIGAGGHMDYDKFRGLIILINYTDKKFEDNIPSNYTPYDFYDQMINSLGYTGYTMPSGTKKEMTGSVRDFYFDNSNQVFDPHFDILGPVDVDFASTDARQFSGCPDIFFAAIDSLDNEVDFSDYDIDEDGTVDMVFFLVAGWGSDYSSNNRQYLWPHMNTFTESPTVDGVNFGLYACSTGMTGAEPQYGNGTIGGIGTFCHEFSHVLGLPDLYDADYSASGGQSRHPSNWSVMASGFKLNNGYSPAGYSLYERYALGFAQPQVINGEDSLSLQPVDVCNSGYRMNTAVTGEYFLIENRQQTSKWDKYLPGHGMLIFRVDSTNVDVWENNQVNNDPSHMYYELLRAKYSALNQDSGGDPFPGTGNITSISSLTDPSLRTWSGKFSKYCITDIAENGGVITFNVAKDRSKSAIEDFENMPVGATVNEQGVAGVYADWDFNYCAVVDNAPVGNGHVVAMDNGSYFSTAGNLNKIPKVVRFTIYNPTSSNAVFTPYYSKDNGKRWLSLDVSAYYVSVPAGQTVVASFNAFPTNVPIMLRIKQTSGSSSEFCYVDDVTLYYDSTWEPEPEEPEYELGDVNEDGLVDIDDVTLLIGYVLNGAEYNPAADMNSDNGIDIDDVTALISVILGIN
jgi:M6 family metalloprotease-like protein